jgi:hypothetical protein
MWFRTRDWLRDGGALPDDIDLKNDLVSPTYRVPSTGIIELESKDKIKERLGRSPDLADALALTFAFNVVPNRASVHGGNHHQAQVDYNPLG